MQRFFLTVLELEPVTNFENRCAPGEQPVQDAQAYGIGLEGVKLSEAKKGFVLLPHRWWGGAQVWLGCAVKRLSRDYERLASTLTGLHWLAFLMLMLPSAIKS